MNQIRILPHFDKMLLVTLLIGVSGSNILHGQNYGLKISVDYGIDRNISSYLHELGNSSIPLPIDQVNSFHPTNLSITYVHQISKLDVHLTAGLMTRKIRVLDHGSGNVGQNSNTQYFLGIGIGHEILKRNPFAINICLDFMFCYQNNETFIMSSLFSGIDSSLESYARYRKVVFGSNPKKIVPMFAPLVEASYELKNGNRLLLGLGMVGQFAKTYSFRMEAIEIKSDQITNYEASSSKFSMFYPFVRAGMKF
jgi:hypothetical protein